MHFKNRMVMFAEIHSMCLLQVSFQIITVIIDICVLLSDKQYKVRETLFK